MRKASRILAIIGIVLVILSIVGFVLHNSVDITKDLNTDDLNFVGWIKLIGNWIKLLLSRFSTTMLISGIIVLVASFILAQGKRQAAYLLMVLPGALFLLAFAYLPMPGIVLAFKKYQMTVPPEGALLQNTFLYSLIHSQWNGLNNFSYLLNDAWMLIRNTVGYNLLFMVVGVVLQVGLAVLINEMRNRKTAKVYHTILFMPYFVSWIVVMYALYAMIADKGFFNQINAMLGNKAVKYYSKKQYWPWIFLLANVWKYTGQGSIIYLATLTGFDEQLYEAGAIDGASKWQQFKYITLPQLMPVIVMLQILAVGRIFNGDFDMFYSLPNGSGTLRKVTSTIDTYVYDMLKKGNLVNSFGYAGAGAFFQSIVGFVLILLTNGIVRKKHPEMALF